MFFWISFIAYFSIYSLHSQMYLIHCHTIMQRCSHMSFNICPPTSVTCFYYMAIHMLMYNGFIIVLLWRLYFAFVCFVQEALLVIWGYNKCWFDLKIPCLLAQLISHNTSGFKVFSLFCDCLPEGAVLSFVQAGEAAVQTGDLTVGDWGGGTRERELTTIKPPDNRFPVIQAKLLSPKYWSSLLSK